MIYLQQQEEPGDFTPVIDAPGRGNYFSEFAVGKIGDVFRENTGKLLKAGSRLGFDIHYHSVGEELTDSTDVGIWALSEGLRAEVPGVRTGDGCPTRHGDARHPAGESDGAPRVYSDAAARPARELPAPHARPVARRCRWRRSTRMVAPRC